MKKIIALLLSLVMMMPAAAFAAADGNATETVVADYKMNADEGFAAGNLISYTDPTQGTYYKAANTRVNFGYSQTVTEGTLVVEYDLNSLGNPSGGNYNTLHMVDSAVDIYKHATWVDTGKWVHFRHEIDIEAKTITTYKGDDTEGDTVVNVSGLGSGFTASSISVDAWHSMGFGIDNLVVTNVIGPPKPCRVTEAAFEGKDGIVSTEISNVRNGVVAVNLRFSGIMDQNSVYPSLMCDGEPVDADEVVPVWIEDDLLRIALKSGEFEYEKPYVLTIPAGFADEKGGTAEEDYVLNFECINFSGVIAYYDMEIDRGGITGAYNTREFKVEDNGNTYLDVYNDRIVFSFDEAATGGTLTIDFDYKNIDVNNNLACSIKLDEDGRYGGEEPSLFKIGGSVGGGDWVKYRVIADIDNDTVDVYRDGVFLETVNGSGLNALSGIKGLQVERWSTHIGLDNLKVYFGNSGIEGYKFRDFSGTTADSPQKLGSAVDCIEVEFENEPDINSFDVTIYNEKTAQNENVVLTANGRYLEIRTEKGYFDVSTDYIMALPKGYTNKFGYVGEDAIEINFNSGDKVFGIMSVNIKKNDLPAVLGNICNGDVLDVEIKYVLTKVGASYDAVVVLTTENNSMLTSFGSANANFSNAGVNTEKYSFTVNTDGVFDTIYAYVWDLHTCVPQIDYAIVK